MGQCRSRQADIRKSSGEIVKRRDEIAVARYRLLQRQHEVQKRYRRKFECFSCHKKGHFAWQGPNKKKKKNNSTKKSGEKNDQLDDCAFVITDRKDSRHLIERFKKMNVSDVWFLDSGASRHISFKRDWFTDFSGTSGEYVMLGDDGACEVHSSGTVKIRKFANNEWLSSTIENVRYVPELHKNLFSVGLCIARGFKVTFLGNRIVILRRRKVVAEGVKQANAIYRMFFTVPPIYEVCTTEIDVSELSANLKLWHDRFGHAGKNSLKRMISDGFVNGIKMTNMDDFFCEPCLFDLPFQKSVERKQWHVVECFHSDVCEPMSMESLGGARYFVR